MSPRFAIVSLALAASIGPASADPADDAAFIVDSTNSEELYVAVFEGIAELMAGTMGNEFRKTGTDVSDAAIATIVDMLTLEMAGSMAEVMRDDMIDIHVQVVSPAALKAYREFLNTEEGREIARLTPTLAREGQKLGEQLGPEIARTAIDAMQRRISAGDFPSGTLLTTQNELRALYPDN